jgi:hypothetical protein
MAGGKKDGPTYGVSKMAMVQPAGRDHVIFSKKLLMVIGIVLLVTLFIFFSVEQSLIAGNLAVSRAALAQNNAIRATNDKLEEAKQELQDEEDELVNMYSKWLDEDNEEIDVSTEDVVRLKTLFMVVRDMLMSHTRAQRDTPDALTDK